MKKNRVLYFFLGIIFIMLVLFGLSNFIFDTNKNYTVKIIKFDNSEVAIVKNISSDVLGFSLKTTFVDNTLWYDNSNYVMPNEETVLFIKNGDTKKVNDYVIDNSLKNKDKIFFDYEKDTNINMSKNEVTIKLTKNAPKQSVEGEIVIYFYDNKNKIIEIKRDNLKFNNNSIEHVVKVNKNFDKVKIIDRFWNS